MEGDDGQTVEVSGVRASVLGGGTACGLKQRWKDGTTHVVMTKEVLMERLCALVPKPRKHLVTYHGVLAPGRDCVRRWCPSAWKRNGKANAAITERLAVQRLCLRGGGERRGGGVPSSATAASAARTTTRTTARKAARSAWWWEAALRVGGAIRGRHC